MSQFDEFDNPTDKGYQEDDSLKQIILFNEIHRSLALDCASFFLKESLARINLIHELPSSPLIIAAHALIAHCEWMHDIDRGRLDEIIKAVTDLSDSIKDVSGSIDAMSSNAATYNKTVIDGLNGIADSVDSANVKPIDFWMTSELAAIDKANEVGLVIPPEWTLDDLRYKLHQAIYGGAHGSN